MDLNVAPLWEEALKISPTLRQPQLSEFTGLSVTAINRAVNGLQHLSLPDFRNLERTILACKEIQRRASVPIDWRNIRVVKELIAAFEEEQRNPPALPSPEDWQLLTLVNDRSKSPVSIAADLNIPLTELSKRMTTAAKRADYSANKLTARSADIGALSEEAIAYVGEQQAKRNQQQ